MIRYSLRCREGHVFESWFASADAFDALAAAGRLECAQCGAREVEKTLMAPAVAAPAGPAPTPEQRIAALRAKVEANSTWVGRDFAKEARAMHAGERPERPIHGEARPEEAKALLEEGVPVLPLPFRSRRGSN